MRSRPRVSGNPRWRRKAWTVWLRIATRGLSYNQGDWKTTLIVCVLLHRMQQFLWHGADNSVHFSPVVNKNVALISNCVSERSNSRLKITHVSVWIFAFYVLVRVGKWTHEAIAKYWLIHESLVFNWVFLLSNSRDCLVLSSDDFCLHHRRDLHIHILSWQNKVDNKTTSFGATDSHHLSSFTPIYAPARRTISVRALIINRATRLYVAISLTGTATAWVLC